MRRPMVALAVVLATGCPTPPAGAPEGWSKLLPRPQRVEGADGAFVLGADAALGVSPESSELASVAELLAQSLRPSTGFALPVKAQTDGAAIRLRLDERLVDLGDEGYELTVDRGGVEVRAAAPAGVFYGTQTLRQLFPARIERGELESGPWLLAYGSVRDVPRYPWRGLMVDLARHFFSPDVVRRYVDVMARYKLNRLHLHLTDDQGWRLQISAFPALTQVGGATAVGGGVGGYFTQAEYRELVEYAEARFVTVVPEFDLPGHAQAALASVPELNCDGGPPPVQTGFSTGNSSLCAGASATEPFIRAVLGELCSLTPGPWIHLGGDEAMATSDADYAALVAIARDAVRSHGKRVVGWEDLARADAGVGEVVQHWLDPRLAAAGSANGAQVVLSPARRTYLDMKYGPDAPPDTGTFWAGYVGVTTAYDWDPGAWLPDLADAGVLGVEAPVWTETVATARQLDTMVFPRLLGYAELGWSPPEGKAVRDYVQRLAAQGPRLDAWGIAYYPAPEVPWER